MPFAAIGLPCVVCLKAILFGCFLPSSQKELLCTCSFMVNCCDRRVHDVRVVEHSDDSTLDSDLEAKVYEAHRIV
jgi:hypothetical protein